MDKLPSEILLQIIEQQECKPAPTTLALMQTCTRFRLIFKSLYFNTAVILYFMSKSERLEFLEMLRRDSFRPDLQTCAECFRLHTPDKYTAAEFSKPASKRRCLYVSKMFLCPHKHITFETGRDTLKNPSRYKPDDMKGCSQCHVHFASKLYSDPSNGTLGQRIDVRLMMSDQPWKVLKRDVIEEQFAAPPVRSILRKLDLPICQHTRFSDPYVTQAYDSDLLGLRKQFGPFKWLGELQDTCVLPQRKGTRQRPWKCAEPGCETEFWFEVRKTERTWFNNSYFLMLLVCVRRSMGLMKDVQDRDWLDHMVTDEEQKRNLASWDDLVAYLMKERLQRQQARIREIVEGCRL
jgi:hypothetical protein